MLLDSYLLHLRARNLAPATIKAAREYLQPLITLIEPLNASSDDLRAYLADLSSRCAPSTVWTAWRHMKGFFGYLHAESEIETNPMLRVPRPTVPPTEVAVLSQDEVRRLLATCKSNDREARRDLAIISILLDTGLRLGEIASLTPPDLGPDGTIRVYGKGRKWRTVALGSTSLRSVNRWIRVREVNRPALWALRTESITPSGIRKIVKRRGKQAGIDLHPHMLRHTFVDSWLRNGGSEVDLARIAGWTSTRMTERYAQYRAAERALEAHRVISPLDRLRA